jgi:agmatinase
MTLPLVTVPSRDFTSFLGVPVCTDLDALEAEIAILGIPFGVPYGADDIFTTSSAAPAAIRAQSNRWGDTMVHYDFDLGGTLLDGRAVRIVDCGDVPGDPQDIPGNAARATAAVQAILARGAVPIVLGGDDAIPIPVFRAYQDHGPIFMVQVDAHIDWRHDIDGVTEGFSSPMRRASEMSWIGGMVQVGMRGLGSARTAEVRDALAYGSTLITAREVQTQGAEAALRRIPDGGSYFIAIDGDSLDPSVMPGVNAPTPGGLSYPQVADIVRGVARKGRVVGCDFVELAPDRDINGISALTACGIIRNLIGEMVRSGYW